MGKFIRRAVLGFWIAVGIFVAVGATAGDLDDVEAGMEDALAESEASQEQAAEERERLEEEKDRLNEAKKNAAEAVSKARAKQRQAQSEIRALSRNREKVKMEMGRQLEIKKKADQDYEKQVQLVEQSQRSLKKLKQELDVLDNEKEQAQERLLEKLDENKSLSKEISELDSQKQKWTLKLQKTKEREKEAKAKHDQLQQDLGRKQAQTEVALQKLKAQIGSSRKSAKSYEAQMRALKRKQRKAADELAIAESEAHQATLRKQDAKMRLNHLQKETEKKKHLWKNRKEKALGRRKKLEVREAELRLQSNELGEVNRSYAGVETSGPKAKVNLISAGEQRARTRQVSQDCNVRSRPSGRGPLLGQALKGHKLPVLRVKGSWYQVNYKGKKAFMSASCF